MLIVSAASATPITKNFEAFACLRLKDHFDLVPQATKLLRRSLNNRNANAKTICVQDIAHQLTLFQKTALQFTFAKHNQLPTGPCLNVQQIKLLFGIFELLINQCALIKNAVQLLLFGNGQGFETKIDFSQLGPQQINALINDGILQEQDSFSFLHRSITGQKRIDEPGNT